MPIHQLATDDAWRQTLERIGADIRWIGGRNDPWAPQYQRTGKYEGEAARDALRALNRMGEHQPYAQLHSWGPRPGKRDERGEVTIVNGLHQ
ncbi:MAG: hypothetical protein Q7R80_01550, partial [bacterium]|nr:hypothetical protein [bacterium]